MHRLFNCTTLVHILTEAMYLAFTVGCSNIVVSRGIKRYQMPDFAESRTECKPRDRRKTKKVTQSLKVDRPIAYIRCRAFRVALLPLPLFLLMKFRIEATVTIIAQRGTNVILDKIPTRHHVG